VTTARIRPAWRGHARQRGLTLTEVLVSIAMLAIIGAVVGVAFVAGLKAFGNGTFGNSHTQDRLAGAHDEMAFEQLLSRDVSRSGCVWIPASTKYGSCAQGFANSGVTNSCSGAILCLGWPQWLVAGSSWTCEVAVYSQDASKSPTVVRRQEYSSPSSGSGFAAVTGGGVSTDPVTASISLQTTTAPSGQPWVASLTASLTGTGVIANRPVATLVMRPVAVDPAGSTAAIGTGGNPPC
jgi:prepilin-type N-terminal cleavage/methylation domain-containing protein